MNVHLLLGTSHSWLQLAYKEPVSFENVVHVKFGVILADGDIYVQFHNPCTILSISNEHLR